MLRHQENYDHQHQKLGGGSKASASAGSREGRSKGYAGVGVVKGFLAVVGRLGQVGGSNADLR